MNTEPEPDSRGRSVRRYGLSIGVVLAFAVLGWYLGPMVAPDIVRWRSGLAGAMLGAFSGGAAVLNRLLE